MGKKIWLSMHSINFDSEKIVRTLPHVRPPLHVWRDEILHFKHPRVNRIATRTFRDKKTKQNNDNKADFFYRIILNLYIGVDHRERARARDKNKVDQFRWKKDVKFYGVGKKMRNASGHTKVKMSGTETKVSRNTYNISFS